jgi:hypothetical protein
MAHHSVPNDPDHPNGAPGADSSASLIHVPASAQQAPGALSRCPVCGQPYTSESLAPLPQQTPAEPGIAETAAQQPETPGERLVLRCTYCGTYSVGTLDTQDEAE